MSMTTIVLFAVAIAALAFICKMTVALDDKRPFMAEATVSAVIAAVVAGVSFYMINLAQQNSSIWPGLLAMLAGIYLVFSTVYNWRKDGSQISEMLPHILMVVLVAFSILVPVGAAILEASQYSVLGYVMVGVPIAAGVLAVGLILAEYFSFKGSVSKDDHEAVLNRSLAKSAVAIAACIAVIAMVAWPLYVANATPQEIGNSDAVTVQQPETEQAGVSDNSDTTVITVDDAEWRHFYNLDLQSDEDALNDYNFGPTPTCSTALEYDADFRARLKQDPALAAADTAWLDAIVGTRYLGEFYESCKGDWAKTINLAKDRFSVDQQAFYEDLDAFFAFLDSAVKVSVVKGSDLDDQMYMNPFTKSGIPDVIVMETPDHEGTFLVYTFVIKGTPADVAAVQNGTATPANNGRVFEVPYRIECGYQPTNVQRVMGVKPQKNPVKKPSSQTVTPKENKGDTPTPTPTPTPEKKKYNKDPNKAPKKNTEPNDDKGPGANTNTGVGSKTSSADKPTNSNHYSSYDEYKKDMEEMKQTNQNQKTGSDSNKPSTPAPSTNTKVDSNADKGTGYGGANDPTPVTQPAKEANTGKEINSSPGEAWGGPSD